MRAHQYPLRWFRSLACIALAFTCFLLIAAQPGLAQVDQGAISGLITDPTGAVVSNAQVTLTNTGQRPGSADAQRCTAAEYTFSPVRIGNYQHFRDLRAVSPPRLSKA